MPFNKSLSDFFIAPLSFSFQNDIQSDFLRQVLFSALNSAYLE